jgi:hypothetical protein
MEIHENKQSLALSDIPVARKHHLPLQELILLLGYHMRLLNWWLFFLMFLGFFISGILFWFEVHLGNSLGQSIGIQISRFIMESGAGLIAGVFASSLVITDPTLETSMLTQEGLFRVTLWRYLLMFFFILLCSAMYLFWSLVNGLVYARQQNPLFFLLMWLAPVLVVSMMGLFGSLLTHNATLGMTIASIPLVGALFLRSYLLPIQAVHPFFIPFTLWASDASDWWINRLTLLGIAIVFGVASWWQLHYEERLVAS